MQEEKRKNNRVSYRKNIIVDKDVVFVDVGELHGVESPTINLFSEYVQEQ